MVLRHLYLTSFSCPPPLPTGRHSSPRVGRGDDLKYLGLKLILCDLLALEQVCLEDHHNILGLE